MCTHYSGMNWLGSQSPCGLDWPHTDFVSMSSIWRRLMSSSTGNKCVWNVNTHVRLCTGIVMYIALLPAYYSCICMYYINSTRSLLNWQWPMGQVTPDVDNFLCNEGLCGLLYFSNRKMKFSSQTAISNLSARFWWYMVCDQVIYPVHRSCLAHSRWWPEFTWEKSNP